MLTATFLQALNAFSFQPSINDEMKENLFAVSGCLDAPETLAAGSHWKYDAGKYGFFPLPSVCNRFMF